MTDRLFVYGTLRSDCPDSMGHYLGPDARLLGRGQLPGTLLDLGAYPGLVLRQDDPAVVVGEVYTLGTDPLIFMRLDAYEGPEFRREVLAVRLDSGDSTRAWVYVYCGPTTGFATIRSGDFVQHGRDD